MFNLNFRTKFTWLLFVFGSVLQAEAVPYRQLSIINLIATPRVYEDKYIEVKGYLQFDGELILYVDEIRAKNIDISSGILIQDKSKKNYLVKNCGNKYVVVKGRFVNRNGLFTIVDVPSIFPINSPESCWKSVEEKGTK